MPTLTPVGTVEEFKNPPTLTPIGSVEEFKNRPTLTPVGTSEEFKKYKGKDPFLESLKNIFSKKTSYVSPDDSTYTKEYLEPSIKQHERARASAPYHREAIVEHTKETLKNIKRQREKYTKEEKILIPATKAAHEQAKKAVKEAIKTYGYKKAMEMKKEGGISDYNTYKDLQKELMSLSPMPGVRYAIERLAKSTGLYPVPEEYLQNIKKRGNVKVVEPILKGAGKLISLGAASKIAGAAGLTGKALGGATWGGSRAMEEVTKIIADNEKLTWKQPAKVTLDTAYGATIQGLDQLKSVPERMVAGGISRATWKRLEGLVETGKVTSQDIYRSFIDFGIGSLWEGGKILTSGWDPEYIKTSKRMADEYIPSFESKFSRFETKEALKSFAAARSAGNFDQMEAIARNTADRAVRGNFEDMIKNLKEVGSILKSDPNIEKVATTIVARQLPEELFNMPPAIKEEFGKKLVESVSAGISVPEASEKIIKGLTATKMAEEALRGMAVSGTPDVAEQTQKILQKPISTVIDTQDKGVEFSAAADISARKIDTAEPMALPDDYQEVKPEEFKLYKESEKLIRKYASGKYAEGITPQGTAGAFMHQSKNTFIRSSNNLSIVTHELLHPVDKETGFTNKIMEEVGTDKKGRIKYNPATLKMRKELTKGYVELYGGKKNHPLSKRIPEGFAAITENFTMHPTTISKEYPLFVKEVLSKGGQYNVERMNEFLKDVQLPIAVYQRLNPQEKIISRMTGNAKIATDKKLYNMFGKGMVKRWDMELLNDIGFLSDLEKGTAADWTAEAPSMQIRLFRAANSLLVNNLTDQKGGYWGFNEKLEPVKLFDYNWANLNTKIFNEGNVQKVGARLIARRAKGDYDKVDRLRLLADKLKLEVDQLDPKEREKIKDLKKQIRLHLKEASRVSKILEKDGYSRELIEEENKQFGNEYLKELEMFDNLVKADRDFLHHPAIQILNHEQYKKYELEDWYAPSNRVWTNEIVGPEEYSRSMGGGKIGALIERVGSELPTINPVYSAQRNHIEIMKKGLRQGVYNKLLNIIDAHPDLFQEWRYTPGIEKEEEFVIGMRDYKKVPIMINSQIKEFINKALTYEDMPLVEKIFTGVARVFMKGTTGMSWRFAAKNPVRDQIMLGANTLNKTKPFVGVVNTVYKVLHDHDGPEANFAKEFIKMGGASFSLHRMYDMEYTDFIRYINKEHEGMEKFLDGLDKVENFLSTPAKWSELSSRITEYVRARMAGKEFIVAFEEAGRATGPYHYRPASNMARLFYASQPYLRPKLLITREIAKALDDPKRRGQGIFMMAALAVATMGSLATFSKFATEDQKQQYKGLSPEELAGNIFFPSPNGKRLLRWPVGEELGFIPATINMAMADIILDHNYSVKDYANALTSWMPDQINITEPARMILNYLPFIIKPPVATVVFEKKTWPSVKDIEGGLKHLPVPYRAYSSTGPVARVVAKVIPGWLNRELKLSPVKIEALVEGYGGTVSRVLLGKNPIGNPFAREVHFQGMRSLHKYYAISDENKQNRYALEHEIKQFTPEEENLMEERYEQLKTIRKIIDEYNEIPDNDRKAIVEVRSVILDEIDILR